MTYYDLLLSAVNNALHGVPPEQSAALDAVGIADSLFDTVSQSVSESAAANEYNRSLLRRQKSITLVAGSATLSDDVLTKYIADAILLDPASLTKHYAWRDYPDFVRRGDPRLGVFTMEGGTTFLVREPNQWFSVPLTATGARILIVPCVVLKPGGATEDVDAPDEVISDLVEALSEALKGQLAKTAGANV